MVLPFSGLRAMVSSRYFQGAEPTDHRQWIAPALLVEPSFEAWQAGKDQALEAILAQPLPETTHGVSYASGLQLEISAFGLLWGSSSPVTSTLPLWSNTPM